MLGNQMINYIFLYIYKVWVSEWKIVDILSRKKWQLSTNSQMCQWPKYRCLCVILLNTKWMSDCIFGWGSGTNVTFLMPVTCCLGEFILFFELIVLPLPTLLLSQWPFSGFQVSHGQYRWSASPQPHVIVALNRLLSSFCLLCSHCQQPAQTWHLSLFLAVSLSRCITLLWGAYGLRLPAFGASCRILQVLSAQTRFSVLPGEMSACDLHTY